MKLFYRSLRLVMILLLSAGTLFFSIYYLNVDQLALEWAYRARVRLRERLHSGTGTPEAVK